MQSTYALTIRLVLQSAVSASGKEKDWASPNAFYWFCLDQPASAKLLRNNGWIKIVGRHTLSSEGASVFR